MELSLAVNLPTIMRVLVEPIDRITIDGQVGLLEATVTDRQLAVLQRYSGMKSEASTLIDVPEIERHLKTLAYLDEDQELVDELIQDAIAAGAKFVLAIVEQ